MTQSILISLVGLLIGNTVADVLVQPGFGQPTPSLLQQPIVEPFSTLPNARSPGLLQPHSPGYHLELHPVFGNLGHSTGGSGYLQAHDLPSLLGAPSGRFHIGRLGGLGLPGTHGFIPPHIPVSGLRRHRRSTGELSNAGVQEKRSSVAVATKPTLNGNNPTVVDLVNQNTEEKHVKVRHCNNAHATSSSTLLGLNPSSMYPVQNQYRFAMPTYGRYRQIVNEHPEIAAGQMNSRAAIQEQATTQNRAATSTQNTIPRINPADLQRAMLLQQPYQQKGTSQTAVEDQQRNYPDPRPATTTQSSAKAQKNDRNKLKNTATSRESKIAVSTNDQEIVGSSAGHHEIKLHSHVHPHGSFIPRNNVINEAYSTCGCSNPSYVVYYNGNDETTNNLASTQLSLQQPAQVYQLAPVQENYQPNSGYIVLPQSYSNPIVNYDGEYPTGLTGSCYTQDGNILVN